MKYYSIHEFSKILGVTPQTLRNWDAKGKLKPDHTRDSGYRYYSQKQLNEFLGIQDNGRKVVGYCRVSSNKPGAGAVEATAMDLAGLSRTAIATRESERRTMMADLISRAALRKALASGIYPQSVVVAEAVALLDELLRDAPTIDAEPVVRARWMDDMYFDEPVTRCTACKRGFSKGHKAERFPYCPGCGAKMDADAPERAGKEREDA